MNEKESKDKLVRDTKFKEALKTGLKYAFNNAEHGDRFETYYYCVGQLYGIAVVNAVNDYYSSLNIPIKISQAKPYYSHYQVFHVGLLKIENLYEFNEDESVKNFKKEVHDIVQIAQNFIINELTSVGPTALQYNLVSARKKSLMMKYYL